MSIKAVDALEEMLKGTTNDRVVFDAVKLVLKRNNLLEEDGTRRAAHSSATGLAIRLQRAGSPT